jgi:hypothetical protein
MCCQPGGIVCQSPAAIEPRASAPPPRSWPPRMRPRRGPWRHWTVVLSCSCLAVGAERAQRAGAPAGLLVGLADRSLPGRLAGLDAPGGDLPASGVGDDEAVDKAGLGAGTGRRAIVASRWTLVERRGRGDGIGQRAWSLSASGATGGATVRCARSLFVTTRPPLKGRSPWTFRGTASRHYVLSTISFDIG